MSKSNQLNKLFPGLASGPPQLARPQSFGVNGDAANDAAGKSDGPQAPPELSPAQVHFQQLLSKLPGHGQPQAQAPVQAQAQAQAQPQTQAQPQAQRKEQLQQENMNSSASSVASSVASGPTGTAGPVIMRSVQVAEMSHHQLPKTAITRVNIPLPANLEAGAKIASTSQYIAYAVKEGMVRVIHSSSVKSVLLKNAGKVIDIKFSPQLPSVMATLSGGMVIVWDLRYDEASEAVQYRETAKLAAPGATSICWHPTNAHVFAVAHGSTVSCVQLSQDLWVAMENAGEQGAPIADVRMASVTTDATSVGASFDPSGLSMFVFCDDGFVRTYDSQPLVEVLSSQVELQWTGGMRAHNASVLNASVLKSGSVFTAALEAKNSLVARLWVKSMGEWVLKEALVFPGPGPLSIDPTGTFLVCGSWSHNALFVTKITGDSFGPVAQFQLECPLVSLAIREQADKKLAIFVQQTKGIGLFVLDPATPLPQMPQASVQLAPSTSAEMPQASAPSAPEPSKILERKSSSNLVTPEHLLKKTMSANLPPKPTTPTPASIPAPAMASAPAPAHVSPVERAAPAKAEPPAVDVASLNALLTSHMDALYSKLNQDAEARAQKNLEYQKTLLAALHESMSDIEETIKDALDEEALATIGQEIAKSLVNSDMSSNVSNKIVAEVRKPITEAFTTAFQQNIIPAFEAGCGNMIEQIKQSVPHEPEPAAAPVQAAPLQAHSARRFVPPQYPNNRTPSPGVLLSECRHPMFPEIFNMIQAGHFDNAVHSALTEMDLDLVAATLKRLNPTVLFPESAPSLLSDITLITLLHQLSSDLSTEQNLKLQWIRCAGLAVNPHEPSIAQYFPEMINQIVTHMENAKPLFKQGSPIASTFDLCLSIVVSKSQYKR